MAKIERIERILAALCLVGFLLFELDMLRITMIWDGMGARCMDFVYIPIASREDEGILTKVMSYAVFCSILLGEVQLAGHACLLLGFLHTHNYIFSSNCGLHCDFASFSFTSFSCRSPRCPLVLY